jgi:uncharacterized protein (UPF0332 family)
MTPAQKSLIDKATRSLDAARSLFVQGFSEFSVSRSYYAMFYVAEAFLDSEGHSFSSHAAVISAFGQHFARPGKVPVEFHRHLIDAQARRTQADYDPNPCITEADAAEQISWAEMFIACAQNSIRSSLDEEAYPK